MITQNIVIGKRIPLLNEMKAINPAKIYDGMMDVIFQDENTEMKLKGFPSGIGNVLEKHYLMKIFRKISYFFKK